DAYKATYATQMQLLRGREDLEEPQEPFFKPPIDMRKPGRPAKKRKLGHDEHVSEKRQRTCKRCNQIGHNRRTCAGGEVGSNPKGRRPRTMVDGGTQETTYPDPAECSSSRRRRGRGRGRGSRGGRGRGRGSASTSAAASTSASTSQTAPSTSSAPASRGRGGRGGRGARGGRGVVQQTLRQSVNGACWFSQTLSQTFQAPKPQKKGTFATQ
ncbi:hypothetical protein MKW92_021044, partial [Papaver armeniacum]